MADKPIIFSAPMVRALFDGRKTQMRQALNPQPKVLNNGTWYRPYPVLRPLHWEYLHGGRIAGFTDAHYAPGDRLWVREHWRTADAYDDLAPSQMGGEEPIIYLSDDAMETWGWGNSFVPGRRRLAMHMPRWATRLTDIVTQVRVQRVQDITEEDAIAEGIERLKSGRGFYDPTVSKAAVRFGEWTSTARQGYQRLWNSLHGPGAWEANPWVAAYSFTVQRGNIDAPKETSND